MADDPRPSRRGNDADYLEMILNVLPGEHARGKSVHAIRSEIVEGHFPPPRPSPGVINRLVREMAAEGRVRPASRFSRDDYEFDWVKFDGEPTGRDELAVFLDAESEAEAAEAAEAVTAAGVWADGEAMVAALRENTAAMLHLAGRVDRLVEDLASPWRLADLVDAASQAAREEARPLFHEAAPTPAP